MDKPVLATHCLSKQFGAITASDAVSITLKSGEIHAIIGPNGAGKTTLIAQICGTLSPSSGSVEFLGQDITRISATARAHAGLARTFQMPALAMDNTVLENAMLGALGASKRHWRMFRPAEKAHDLREVATYALERVGLRPIQHQRAAELSHGQRRQLDTAIALTLKPKALVMDEPMAGLGAEGSKILTGFLDKLRQETPILLVEHDMDAVFALADRITVLVAGRVLASGSVAEIRSNKDVQKSYLGGEAI